jgi:hypothetical protein
MGGSVEATDDGTVSVVPALDTGRATVSKADIPEEVTTVMCEGVGCPVSSL